MFSHTSGIPRRINRLCSRVLLYGVLEETHDITGDMVEATAVELARDLEGIRPEGVDAEWANAASPGRADAVSAALGPANSHAALLIRIEALENQMAEREQVFRRLTQMLGVSG